MEEKVVFILTNMQNQTELICRNYLFSKTAV